MAITLFRGSESPCSAAPETVRRTPGILVVDDTDSIRSVLTRELERRGFNVWPAASGDEAFDSFRRHGDEIDLVLLDVQMPGLDGPNTLAAIQLLDADVAACFMTGSGGAYSPADLLKRGACRVFTKPFRLGQIADVLRRIAAQRSVPFDPASIDFDDPEE
jgi:DNA-binding NtrC family response regulator